uniref:Uncharacterized protein n=1 Tax=Magallana gigas TaxID=29159 RepID=K1QX45_MAGGI
MPTDKKRKSKQGAMSPSEKEQAAERDAQSPVKKEKHKLNKSLVRDLVTENGVKSDTVCSPRKRKLTNTATSEASRVDFTGQLQIINKMDVPSAPPIPVPPKKEHPIPDTLRQRFIPFGAEKMELIEESESVPKKSKKKKKTKG